MKKAETELESSVEIRGSFHEDFQEVAETFAQNFDKYKEIGSSVCVVIDGETAVDLWAGYKNEQRTCLLYTSPSPRDKRQSRMPSSA